jgi:hypothetical protein
VRAPHVPQGVAEGVGTMAHRDGHGTTVLVPAPEGAPADGSVGERGTPVGGVDKAAAAHGDTATWRRAFTVR